MLNILDVWSTYKSLHNVRGTVEANPLARWLIKYDILIAWKVVLVVFAGIWCFKTKDPARYTQILCVVVVIFSVAVYSNFRLIY